MQPQSKLQQLRDKIKRMASVTTPIIEIPAWRFSCPNHGKEKTFHSFEKDPKGNVTDIECECGTVYRKVSE